MPEKQPFELEVCVDTFSDAMLACEAGATRLEWNQALDSDGLTPSVSSCRWLVRNATVPVVAMIRPHDRGFLYTEQELTCMLEDCRAIVDAGVAGIVFGALDKEMAIDWRALKEVSKICAGVELVFHKAFDCLDRVEQLVALPELRACGVKRILTSGGMPTVSEGSAQIKDLCEAAQDQPSRGCEILAGGGVGPGILHQLFEETGCTQFHGSFRFGASYLDPNGVREAAAIVKELEARHSA